MEFEFFIGIDVSKNELDFSVQQGKLFLFHKEIANEPAAINTLLKEIVKLKDFSLSKTIFCLEHTGIYSNHLLSCLYQKKLIFVWSQPVRSKNHLVASGGKTIKLIRCE